MRLDQRHTLDRVGPGTPFGARNHLEEIRATTEPSSADSDFRDVEAGADASAPRNPPWIGDHRPTSNSEGGQQFAWQGTPAWVQSAGPRGPREDNPSLLGPESRPLRSRFLSKNVSRPASASKNIVDSRS